VPILRQGLADTHVAHKPLFVPDASSALDMDEPLGIRRKCGAVVLLLQNVQFGKRRNNAQQTLQHFFVLSVNQLPLFVVAQLHIVFVRSLSNTNAYTYMSRSVPDLLPLPFVAPMWLPFQIINHRLICL
jgi:hypothetical protein